LLDIVAPTLPISDWYFFLQFFQGVGGVVQIQVFMLNLEEVFFFQSLFVEDFLNYSCFF
jgi:hypothetical protein